MPPKKRVRVDVSSDAEDDNAPSAPGSRKSPYVMFQPYDKDLRLVRCVPNKTTAWYEMVRVLYNDDDGSGPFGRQQQLSSWMVHAMLDVPHPSRDAPGPNSCWTCAVGNESWAERAPQVVLDLLRFVIQAEDARLTGLVWMVMKKRAGSWEAAHELVRSNGIFARLLFKDTPEQVIKTFAFLALVSRRPRLLNAVLDSYKCHVVMAGDEQRSPVVDGTRNGRRVCQNLTCIALAIMDCVFAADHAVSYDESYKAFEERSSKATGNTDTALKMEAWREAVKTMVALCRQGIPECVWMRGPDEENTKQTNVLSLAARCAELCPEFLDSLLDARGWGANVIEAAMRVVVSAKGVRGPNFSRAIHRLYLALLYEWKQQPAKCERGALCNSDELGMVWRNLIVSASGYDAVETGSGGNAPVPMSPFLAKMEEHQILPVGAYKDHACMRHPEEWKEIFDAMIECHNPNSDSEVVKQWSYPLIEPSVWDTTSTLFESIMRQVVCKLMDEPQKTKLLLYFIKKHDDCRGKGKGPPCWLFIPNLFHAIASRHPLVLSTVLEHAAVDSLGIKHTHVDDKGVDTGIPAPLNSYHEDLNTALVFCIMQKRRQPVRMLISALRGHLHSPVVYHEDEQEIKTNFLPYYVQTMGAGATEEERNKHGEDYGAFVNTVVEKDFKAVLNAMDWTMEQREEALRFASHYQRPVCAAQLLSSPHCLSAGDDPYLMAISAWLHEPDNQGAKQAESEFLAARRERGDAPHA